MAVRSIICAFLLALAGHGTAAPLASFGGSWLARWCAPGQPATSCGTMELRLVQLGERLCGSFTSHALGGDKADGGRVRGHVLRETAVLTVASELRDGSVWLGTLARSGNAVAWEKIHRVKDADRADFEDAIPSAARLSAATRRLGEPPRCEDV
jgi:hypothetical protein